MIRRRGGGTGKARWRRGERAAAGLEARRKARGRVDATVGMEWTDDAGEVGLGTWMTVVRENGISYIVLCD
jgi:hypothetical protein